MQPTQATFVTTTVPQEIIKTIDSIVPVRYKNEESETILILKEFLFCNYFVSDVFSLSL